MAACFISFQGLVLAAATLWMCNPTPLTPPTPPLPYLYHFNRLAACFVLLWGSLAACSTSQNEHTQYTFLSLPLLFFIQLSVSLYTLNMGKIWTDSKPARTNTHRHTSSWAADLTHPASWIFFTIIIVYLRTLVACTAAAPLCQLGSHGGILCQFIPLERHQFNKRTEQGSKHVIATPAPVAHVQLVPNPVAKRMPALSADEAKQLESDMHKWKWFPIQCDESHGISNTARLAVFICMVFDDFSV